MVCGRIIISLNKANCWLYGWLTKPCVVQSAVVCCDLVFGNGRRVGLTAPPTMTFQGEDRCVEMSSLYCETSALHFATSLTNMACVLRLVVVSTWNITWYVSWFVAVPERRDSAIETNSQFLRWWGNGYTGLQVDGWTWLEKYTFVLFSLLHAGLDGCVMWLQIEKWLVSHTC